MTTASKKAAAAKRGKLTAAPRPRNTIDSADATKTGGAMPDAHGDAAAGRKAAEKNDHATPVPGIDPRFQGKEGLDANNLPAAPPTPTVESAATANDEPGAGSSFGAVQPQVPQTPASGRKSLLRGGDTQKVHVATAFTLNDGAVETHYPVGPATMPREHAEHWYTKNHLGKAD